MNAIEPIQTRDVVPMPAQENSHMAVLSQAIASGASAETLEKLMGLQERYEANMARKDFNEAISAAKSEIGPIFKNRKVEFTTAKGRTNYDFEDLAGIARTVDPVLSRHGLSYRFRSGQRDSSVSVTCIMAHKSGHTEETTLEGFRDDSGNKNPIQAVGSTVTYLQRYTLKLALGLAATADTDAITPPEGSGIIDSAQLRYLRDLIDKANANEAKLLAFLNAESIEGLTQAQYKIAEASLRKKIASTKAGA